MEKKRRERERMERGRMETKSRDGERMERERNFKQTTCRIFGISFYIA